MKIFLISTLVVAFVFAIGSFLLNRYFGKEVDNLWEQHKENKHKNKQRVNKND